MNLLEKSARMRRGEEKVQQQKLRFICQSVLFFLSSCDFSFALYFVSSIYFTSAQARTRKRPSQTDQGCTCIQSPAACCSFQGSFFFFFSWDSCSPTLFFSQ